jgi:SAM-dependent methyltransferase
MRWVAKAAIQKSLSLVPAGERFNYLLQRKVTRQLPRSDEHFRLHATETVRHFRAYRRYVAPAMSGPPHFYEFGAGWDLITPLLYSALGVERQTLVDIRANLRFEQIDHSLAQLTAHRDWLAKLAPEESWGELDTRPVRSTEDLEARFGIAYLAPRDARATGMPSGSVDFVSSTYTLEHIPADDIAAILVESRRLLAPGGALSAVVDMKDHYSYGDTSISPFNFLKFGDRAWGLVNSSLHNQNRLRRSDYLRLVEGAGLTIVDDEHGEPSPADLATVAGLRRGRRFAGYDGRDLAVREVHLVARAD